MIIELFVTFTILLFILYDAVVLLAFALFKSLLFMSINLSRSILLLSEYFTDVICFVSAISKFWILTVSKSSSSSFPAYVYFLLISVDSILGFPLFPFQLFERSVIFKLPGVESLSSTSCPLIFVVLSAVISAIFFNNAPVLLLVTLQYIYITFVSNVSDSLLYAFICLSDKYVVEISVNPFSEFPFVHP